jgi:transposase, IS30 family
MTHHHTHKKKRANKRNKKRHVVSYRRITDRERDCIAFLLGKGTALTDIAHKLKRSVSSISREVNGRCDQRSGLYFANLAERKRIKEKAKQRKPVKLEANPRLLLTVCVGMCVLRWSPEQISRRLKKEYPRDSSMHITPETIYEYVLVRARGDLRRYLQSYLRRPRRGRKQRSGGPSLKGTLPNLLSIDQRPKGVLSRRIPGHWESDLIVGKNHKSALISLVERKTRYLVLIRITSLDAEVFADQVTHALNALPAKIKKTLTHDNGREIAQGCDIQTATGIIVYLTHPRSPWERGTNENTNGLVREFFPKGTDFRVVSDKDVLYVQELINGRPRKTLDWMTPSERLLEVLR